MKGLLNYGKKINIGIKDKSNNNGNNNINNSKKKKIYLKNIVHLLKIFYHFVDKNSKKIIFY